MVRVPLHPCQALTGVNVCGLTRMVVPASLVGVAVATVAGRDVVGWIAAGLTVGAVFVWQTVRGTNRTCAISPPTSAAVVDRDDGQMP